MEIDIDTAAKILATPKATLRRWARQGKIPARERTGAYVFQEDELAKWASRRNIPLHTPPARETSTPPASDSSLYAAMKRGGALFDVTGKNVQEVLSAVIDLLPLPSDVDPEALLEQLLDREDLASTGIGHGIAIPHPRHPMKGIPPGGMITTCFLQQEVDFNAIDGRPVSTLFVMLSRDTETHLKLLSRLSFCLRDTACVHSLRECETTDALLAKIEDMEERIKPLGEIGGS